MTVFQSSTTSEPITADTREALLKHAREYPNSAVGKREFRTFITTVEELTISVEEADAIFNDAYARKRRYAKPKPPEFVVVPIRSEKWIKSQLHPSLATNASGEVANITADGLKVVSVSLSHYNGEWRIAVWSSKSKKSVSWLSLMKERVRILKEAK